MRRNRLCKNHRIYLLVTHRLRHRRHQRQRIVVTQLAIDRFRPRRYRFQRQGAQALLPGGFEHAAGDQGFARIGIGTSDKQLLAARHQGAPLRLFIQFQVPHLITGGQPGRLAKCFVGLLQCLQAFATSQPLRAVAIHIAHAQLFELSG